MELQRTRLTEALEGTKINLSKTEQDLVKAQEQLADQKSLTEAMRVEKKRNSQLALECKQLTESLEQLTSERLNLQEVQSDLEFEKKGLHDKISQYEKIIERKYHQ